MFYSLVSLHDFAVRGRATAKIRLTVRVKFRVSFRARV